MKWNLSAPAAARAWSRELRRQFRLIRKVAPIAATGDVIALHDLRVAIRRLRLLLLALEQPLAGTNLKVLTRRWQHMTRELSPLRDTDVWRPLLDGLSEVTPAFRRRVLGRLDREHDDRGTLLAGPIWNRLKRDTQFFLATHLPPALKVVTKPERALCRTWKENVARAAKLARSRQRTQPDVAHKLRIACRRARYLAEFFASAAEPKKNRRAWLKIAQRYAAAQRALGQTHDTDTLLEFLHDAKLRPPAAATAELQARRTAGLAKFSKAWKIIAE